MPLYNREHLGVNLNQVKTINPGTQENKEKILKKSRH